MTLFLYPEEGKRERDGILQCFMDFVDKILALQSDSPIERFSLKCEDGIDLDRVNGWICNVLRRGVSHLELFLDFSFDHYEDFYDLPEELFKSKTLVELKLRSEYGIDWWPGGTCTFLPMLKTLDIDAEGITLLDELEMYRLSFPVLEELYLADMHWLWNETASSASLRKLTICANLLIEAFLNPNTISFGTPNLVYLEYSDFVAADYPKVNLPNLVEVQLKLMVTEDQIKLIRAPNDEDDGFLRLRNVWKLINGIRNVQKLFFTADTLEVLSLCCESMPVFNKLKIFCIKSDKERGWQAIPVLLRNCPQLETLVLENLLHYVSDKCGDACDCISREEKGFPLSSCPVKNMKITGFRGTIREIKMISHFLTSFACLNEMKIYVEENDPTEFEVPGRLKLVTQLWTLYNEFYACNVQFLVSPELYKKWPAE